MRAAHRLKMTLAQLQADANANGWGGSGRVVKAMDQAGVEAIDVLAVELVGHLQRLHTAGLELDGREKAAQLQNLLDGALHDGGNALIAAREQQVRPILGRLGVQMPPTSMFQRLDTCVSEQRAKLRLFITAGTQCAVTNDAPQVEAARRLVELLHEYRDRFDLMLESELAPEACNGVAECLDQMLPYRQVLVDEAALRAMNFAVAHSDLMTELFAAQMERLGSDRKGRLIMMVPAQSLQTHKRAIDQLRAACEGLQGGAAPGTGFQDTRPG
ncbi:MAG: hypothetical protein EOO54_16570 [Haliea sp.]|nr:MAG: hypothetical protein EOO54_16570 [Haliea sp.]